MIKAAGYGLGWVSLSVVLGAGPLRAEGVAVPEGAASTTVRFQAGREPIAFVLHFDGGLKKSITVKPADVQQYTDNNNAKATTCDMPQAGFAFEGLSGIVDFVRPNAVNFVKARRQAIMQGWSNQPAIYGREYDLEFRRAGDGTEYYINGQYAGCEPASAGRLAKVDSPFGPEAFTFSEEAPDPRYHRLDVSRLNQPGLLTNASVEFHGAPVPFRAPTGAALDLGATADHSRLYPNGYGDSGYTGRNAFDHPTNSFLWTVPMRQYTHAWILCAVADDPGRVPTFTARLTRYAPSRLMGGRAYSALGDTTVTVPAAGTTRVGTVTAGGKTVPLWCVEVRLDLGKMIDLITDWKYAPWAAHGRGAFPMHYLDFELLGETPRHCLPWSDPRVFPDPNKASAVHVFGVTLERAAADLRFIQSSQVANVFRPEEKAEMTVAVSPVIPGAYTLSWDLLDVDGRRVGGGRRTTERPCEVVVDLRQGSAGWYRADFRLADAHGRLLTTHTASCLLLDTDTRRAGYDSPYLAWCFGSAHYWPRLERETYCDLLYKLGSRRVFGLSNHYRDLTEKEFEPWKFTEVIAFNGGGSRWQRPVTDEEIRQEIADKLARWPHANHGVIFWESYPPHNPYALAPEVIGQPAPVYTGKDLEMVTQKVAFARQVGRVMSEAYPQVKRQLGNSLTCSELVATVLRTKPPKEYFTAIGTEAGNNGAHPEKPNLLFTTMASRQLMDAAKALGYDYRVNGHSEGISRKAETLGASRQAEWLARDVLVQYVYGFEDISGAGVGFRHGNAYASSKYGTGPLGRAPYLYPRPWCGAMANLTRLLDQVEFRRLRPTGSETVYAAEFRRAWDGKFITVFWTSRGRAELRLKLGKGGVEQVDFYGRKRFPRAWFRRHTLEASTALTYLLTDAPIESAACGRRSFPEETAFFETGSRAAGPADILAGWRPEERDEPGRSGFRVIEPADALADWRLEDRDDPLVDDGNDRRYRARGRASVREVKDPEKGPCLELAIESDAKLHKMMSEYAVLLLKEPVPIEGDTTTIGMWVKGNSGWGNVFWILEDAAGTRRYSSGSLYHGGNINDYEGRAAVNFEGWCFLSLPVHGGSPLHNVSTGSIRNEWAGKWADPVQPVRLVGVGFLAPAHPLYLTEYKPCRQTIRLKDISVLTAPLAARTRRALVIGSEATYARVAPALRALGYAPLPEGTRKDDAGREAYGFPDWETLLTQADWVGLFSTPITASDMGAVKDYVHNGGILVVAGSAVAELLAKLQAAETAIPGLDTVERDLKTQSPIVRLFGTGRMIFSATDKPEALRGFPLEGEPGRPAA